MITGVCENCPELSQDVLAVTVWEPEVEHDQIRRPGCRLTQGLSPGPRRRNLVAGGGQCDAQELLNLRFVVNDEDAASRHRAQPVSIVIGCAPCRRMTVRVSLRLTAGFCRGSLGGCSNCNLFQRACHRPEYQFGSGVQSVSFSQPVRVVVRKPCGAGVVLPNERLTRQIDPNGVVTALAAC